MDWKDIAIKKLDDSLRPLPTELNDLDWKSGLSCKTTRLAQHISAMANHQGGGFLVFGIDDDGSCFSLTQDVIKNIVQLLGNIAHNNLINAVAIEHCVVEYAGCTLLIIYVPEQKEKPVYLRGSDIFNSYHRSAGQTVKMSRSQVRAMIASSQDIPFELQPAMSDLSDDDTLNLLNYKVLYHILDKNLPNSSDTILEKLRDFGFCSQVGATWSVTNLGALLLAVDLEQFPRLKSRAVIVRKYFGKNNRQLQFEQRTKGGYIVEFDNLIDLIMRNTGTEVIDLKRTFRPTYPHIAIREFVVNALVHQDFNITGSPVTVEIFANRLVITNPGVSLNDINRLIDLPPVSRNEALAQTMFLLNICERRGSGIDRAIEAIESMFLPAPKFTKTEQHTRVTLFPQKDLSKMTKQEKILACYQHACLKFEDNESINNQSIRERFELNKNRASVASRIIADTLEAGLIKVTDNDVVSKKYATYIPFYG